MICVHSSNLLFGLFHKVGVRFCWKGQEANKVELLRKKDWLILHHHRTEPLNNQDLANLWFQASTSSSRDPAPICPGPGGLGGRKCPEIGQLPTSSWLKPLHTHQPFIYSTVNELHQMKKEDTMYILGRNKTEFWNQFSTTFAEQVWFQSLMIDIKSRTC